MEGPLLVHAQGCPGWVEINSIFWGPYDFIEGIYGDFIDVICMNPPPSCKFYKPQFHKT